MKVILMCVALFAVGLANALLLFLNIGSDANVLLIAINIFATATCFAGGGYWVGVMHVLSER